MQHSKELGKLKGIKSLHEALDHFSLLFCFQSLVDRIEGFVKHGKDNMGYESFIKFLKEKMKSMRADLTNVESTAVKNSEDQLIDSILTSFDIFNAVFMQDFNSTFSCGGTKPNEKNLENISQTSRDLCDLFFRISLKKQSIILESYNFIKLSQQCLTHLIRNDVDNFTAAQRIVSFHLRMCIRDCENLLEECGAAKKLKLENFPSATFLIDAMVKDCSKEVDVLKKLEMKISHKKKPELFLYSEENETNSLVFFVYYYVNIMLLCNMMIENAEYENDEFLDRLNNSILRFTEREKFTSGSCESKIKVDGYEYNAKNKFCIRLIQLRKHLEWKFKSDCEKYVNLQPFREECLRRISCYCVIGKADEAIECDNPTGEENEIAYAMFKSSSRKAFCQSSISGASINTLHEALENFGLLQHFREVEESLEGVRKNKIDKQKHCSLLKDFDKKLQNLSLRHHPDKVKNRGCSDVELENAQRLQTALNAIRTVLSFLNNIFMENLDVDYKYGFFLDSDIGVLGNEDEVENIVYDILLKISFLSEIKQQRIISEIRKFLIKSQNCLNSFVSKKERDFRHNYFLAMKYLDKCIRWYEKLAIEYDEVEEECTLAKLENMASLLRKMKNGSSSQMRSLKKLYETASLSLEKPLRVFRSPKHVDDYYVLPFVRYINTILMCHAMTKPASETREGCLSKVWSFLWTENQSSCQNQISLDEDPLFADAFYLASYYSGNSRHEWEAEDVMNKMPNADGIKEAFRECVEEIRKNLEDQFKIDDYTVRSANAHIRNELKNCMEMAATFDKTAEQLAEEISEFKKETRKMAEEYQMEEDGEDFSHEMRDA